MKHVLKSLAAVTLASASLCASALPARDNQIIYFTDQTMKVEAGDFMMYCSGMRINTGVRTPYYVRYQMPCDGSTLGPVGPICIIDGNTYVSCPTGIWYFLNP